MYAAIDLAKYIVTKCTHDDTPISNLQLQKILYYVQKAFLDAGKAAFSDDIQAWQFGPVVPSVYYFFCGFGAMPISSTYEDCPIVASPDKEIIDSIVEAKRNLNPWELVAETHKPMGAWARTYNNGAGNRQTIHIDLIKAVG